MCDMTHLRVWHACLVSVTKLFVCVPWLPVCMTWLSMCVTWLIVWTLDSTGKNHSQWHQNVNESVNGCICQWECFCQKALSIRVFLPKSQKVNNSVFAKTHSLLPKSQWECFWQKALSKTSEFHWECDWECFLPKIGSVSYPCTGWLQLVGSFIGLFCKRDLYF